MKRFKSIAPLCLLLAAAGLQPQAAFAQTSVQAGSEADRRLKAIYESYSDWAQKEFGFFEDGKGQSQSAGFLPKVDPASQLARAEYLKRVQAELDAVPVAQLSPGERVNVSVLRAI